MNKHLLRASGLLALVVFLLAACHLTTVRGSGTVISESREVDSFDKVNLNGIGQVVITQGGKESLVVETDDNIMQYVTTDVTGGTLNLGQNTIRAPRIDPTQLTFAVQVDDLNSLSVSGAGEINASTLRTGSLVVVVSGSGEAQIESLTAAELSITVSGSGHAAVAGEVASQEIDLTGSGSYAAGDLLSEVVDANVSGSGSATVWASGSLNADISGSGSVRYYGNPTVNSATSGSGNIRSLGEK